MKKTVLFGAVLAGLALLAYYCHPLFLTAWARFFSVTTATRGADAAVVLGGGIETRFPHAVSLCRAGYAPRILLTQTASRSAGLEGVLCTELDNARALQEHLNVRVPVAVVPSRTDGATSTFDEAYDLRRYCAEKSFNHIIIVTDVYHTRRALYAFQKVFSGTPVRVEVSGAENDVFSSSNWWKTDLGISAYILEPVKYAVYLLTDKNPDFIENY